MIPDRTGSVRKAANERSVKFGHGHQSKMTEDQMKAAKRLLRDGQSIRQAAGTYTNHFGE